VGPFLYSAVQVFLDETMKRQIQIIKGDPKEFLVTVIDGDQLPPEYGGSCDGVRCAHGGLGLNQTYVKGCVDVLDSSNLRPAGVPDGLDSQDVSYDFEKIVTAEKEGDMFSWYFEVEGDSGYDIDFSVELLPVNGQKQSDVSKKTLIEKVKRLKTSKGAFKAPYAGAKLLFRWDNNFSWMASKQLKYSVECQPPSDSVESLLGHGGNSPSAAAAAASASAAAAQ